MWKIEISYKHTSVISHLIYDTKEQAEANRDKLTVYIGKDLYDLKKNGGENYKVSLEDKFGTLDVVPSEVKAVRLYNGYDWDDYALERNSIYERKIAKARKEGENS